MEVSIVNTDPLVQAYVKELLRWSGDNILTIIILTNVLTYFKVLALKSPNVVDDKIVTLLLNFITFKWVGKVTTKSEK